MIQLVQSQNNLNGIAGNSLSKVIAIKGMVESLQEESMAVRGLSMTSELRLSQELFKRLADARASYDQLEQRFVGTGLNAGEFDFLAQTQELKSLSRKLNDRVMQLAGNDQDAEARALFWAEAREPVRRLIEMLQAHAQFQAKALQNRYQQACEEIWFGLGMLALVVAGLCLTFLLMAHFLRSIQRCAEVVKDWEGEFPEPDQT